MWSQRSLDAESKLESHAQCRKKMFIKIVDQSTGGWGHITIDNFQFDADVLEQYPEWPKD